MITSYDELYHYGVLGMRWGVRHDKRRSKKKLSKIDSKVRKEQSKTNGSQSQRDISRLEGKGSKWIESMKSIFSKAGLNTTDANALKKIGLLYLGGALGPVSQNQWYNYWGMR